jgi:hypothetical protein
MTRPMAWTCVDISNRMDSGACDEDTAGNVLTLLKKRGGHSTEEYWAALAPVLDTDSTADEPPSTTMRRLHALRSLLGSSAQVRATAAP